MEVTHIAVEQIIKAFLFILFAFFSVFKKANLLVGLPIKFLGVSKIRNCF